MAVTATSGLVYGFGELIQLQSDNNELLRAVVSKKEEESIHADIDNLEAVIKHYLGL